MYVLNFDNNYYEWAKCLIRSHDLNVNRVCDEDKKIFASTVNLSLEQIRELKSIHENLIISNTFVNKKDIPIVSHRIAGNGFDIDDQYTGEGHFMPEFMANRSCFVMKEVFDKFPEEKHFIFVDADQFINKNFSFEEQVKDSDAGLIYSREVSVFSTYNSNLSFFPLYINTGVMLLKNNSNCENLINLWIENSIKHKNINGFLKDHWFWDQTTLSVTVEKMIENNEITITNIDKKKFINQGKDKNAFIWSEHEIAHSDRNVNIWEN